MKRILAAAAVGGLLGTLLFSYWVLRQRDAQAGIAFLYLPLVTAVSALAGGVYGWSAITALRPRLARRGGWPLAIWILAALVFAGSTAAVTAQLVAVAAFWRVQDPAADPVALERAYGSALAERDHLFLAAIAANPRTPVPILREMAESDDPAFWTERLDPRAGLLDRDYLSVMRRLLRNENVPADVVLRLARSSDTGVLADVAGHRHAPPGLLRELFERSASPPVRYALTTNHGTPEDVLDRIADQPEFRRTLAGNRSLGAATAERLARDPDEYVRMYLCYNLSVPDRILQDLASDPAARVSEAARQQLAARRRAAKSP